MWRLRVVGEGDLGGQFLRRMGLGIGVCIIEVQSSEKE
jgi:hypothetical protein